MTVIPANHASAQARSERQPVKRPGDPKPQSQHARSGETLSRAPGASSGRARAAVVSEKGKEESPIEKRDSLFQ